MTLLVKKCLQTCQMEVLESGLLWLMEDSMTSHSIGYCCDLCSVYYAVDTRSSCWSFVADCGIRIDDKSRNVKEGLTLSEKTNDCNRSAQVNLVQ